MTDQDTRLADGDSTLCSGRIYCPCGQRMLSYTIRQRPRYRCAARTPCGWAGSHRADEVDAEVWRAVSDVVYDFLAASDLGAPDDLRRRIIATTLASRRAILAALMLENVVDKDGKPACRITVWPDRRIEVCAVLPTARAAP